MRVIFIFLVMFPVFVHAQEKSKPGQQETEKLFELGEVTVIGKKQTDSANALSAADLEKFNRTTISTALELLPGVHLANIGARNESVVYVRGFNLRQTPVFIDGVPVYVPYDGYVDMGRFTTFDVEKIQVSKGFASILYGPNTLGGAINLISRRPRKKVELDARAGIFSGEGYRWNINAGSRLGKFYYQAGISQLKQNTFPLSGSFKPVRYQMSTDRENAYREDFKISAKIGFAPKDGQEYVVGYVNQQGEKGNPPYLGAAPRFWKWPEWNKESLFFISNTAIGTSSAFKTRVYYDKFINSLFSYDDSSYTTQKKPAAFQSYYNDYSLGGNAEFETRSFEKHTLKFGIQYKRDIHRENDLGAPVQKMIDNTWAIGIEDTYQVSPKLSFIPGVGWNYRNAVLAEKFNTDTKEIEQLKPGENQALNAQLGTFYHLSPGHQLSITMARKTRFATIKDRYSYRMGRAIPNPDLKSEAGIHYDLSYNGKVGNFLQLQSGIFLSTLQDVIQSIPNVDGDRSQLQNKGRARFYGVEAAAGWQPAANLDFKANYTYIKRKNITNPSVFFTDVPEHKFQAFAGYKLPKSLATINVSAAYNSSRYGSETGARIADYFLGNTAAVAKILPGLNLEAGINNIFDRNYVLAEGFPEAGRNYFLNLHYAIFK